MCKVDAAAPQRTCLGCGKKNAKKNLLRLVVSNGEIVLDTAQKMAGRGAYSCRKATCMKSILKDKKKIARVFRRNNLTWQGNILSLVEKTLQ